MKRLLLLLACGFWCAALQPIAFGGDKNSDPNSTFGDEDKDADGLTNADEAIAKTLPDNPDTDGDGKNDGIDGWPLTIELSPPRLSATSYIAIKIGDATHEATSLNNNNEVLVTNNRGSENATIDLWKNGQRVSIPLPQVFTPDGGVLPIRQCTATNLDDDGGFTAYLQYQLNIFSGGNWTAMHPATQISAMKVTQQCPQKDNSGNVVNQPPIVVSSYPATYYGQRPVFKNKLGTTVGSLVHGAAGISFQAAIFNPLKILKIWTDSNDKQVEADAVGPCYPQPSGKNTFDNSQGLDDSVRITGLADDNTVIGISYNSEGAYNSSGIFDLSPPLIRGVIWKSANYAYQELPEGFPLAITSTSSNQKVILGIAASQTGSEYVDREAFVWVEDGANFKKITLDKEGEITIPPNKYFGYYGNLYSEYRLINKRLEYLAKRKSDGKQVLVHNAIAKPVDELVPGLTGSDQVDYLTHINDQGTLLGWNLGGKSILLLPVELAVDANRDGKVEFGKDKTTTEKPFRFWLNDDDDGAIATEADQVPPTAPDYQDGIIKSRRDLEDFARLHVNIGGLHEALESGAIKATFEWKDVTGTPKIKLYRANTEGNEYLTNASTANALTIAPFRDKLIEIVSGQNTQLPQGFWTRNSAIANLPNTLPTAWFLFEGSGEGKGRLVLTFWKGTEKIGEGGDLWLDIKDIKKMYVRAKGAPENGVTEPWSDNSPEPTDFVSDPNGQPFEQPPGEEKTALIYVHGIHPPFSGIPASYMGNINTAETTFKRLWHAGYKGRFAFYKWPALNPAGFFTNGTGFEFNQSEYRGWKYGRGLAKFAASMPSDYVRHVYAHSQGNAVAGAAFRSYGLQAKSWFITQGAIPISCFDTNPSFYTFNYTTPDLDTQLGYRGVLDNRVQARVINFNNEQDSVTGFVWETNQQFFKPTFAAIALGVSVKYYYYSGSGEVILQKLYGNVVVSERSVNDLYESVSMVVQSRSRSIAHGPTTQGEVSVDVNMPSEFGYGDDHGSQWSNRIQQNVLPYYRRILDEMAQE